MSDKVSTEVESNDLGTYVSPLGAWALAIGTSIGWGSFVVTSNTYLMQAGPAGSGIGMLIGLAVMLVIARNYHFMMNRHPDCGGVYSYAKHVFGFDHGVLAAWFLGITYLAMFWANATSLPLFTRYFIGDVFQFGYMYQLFGYDVYFGEALLSVGAIGLIGLLCSNSKRITSKLTIAMALAFTAAILSCFAVCMANHDGGLFSFDPTFAPDSDAVSQIVRIACISPWAFIGFESISHSTQEFAFDRSKTFRIMVWALLVTTALYVCVTALSITAYPTRYASWFDYIADIGNLNGLEALPPFYAAQYYLGSAGVGILVAALLCLIITSLIGNMIALSRLVYALAIDEVLPVKLARINKRQIPHKAVWLVVVVSLVVPLLGRTTVGWIVDVTTIGAIMIYGLISFSTYKAAREDDRRAEAWAGMAGFVLMLAAAVIFLIPSLFATGSMAPESYFLFTIWAILGFVAFRRILIKDKTRRFGRSTVVWVALLALILFTSLSWVTQSTREATDTLLDSVRTYYEGGADAQDYQLGEEAYMQAVADQSHQSQMGTTALVFVLLAFSLVIMFSNYSLMGERERERERELFAARMAANTDPLTGVKSKRAYVDKERALNAQIEAHTVRDFCVVVCDVNGLKQINDELGHTAGDEHIRAASMLVCQHFKHSPVFRIGGDEFVVIVEGQDYINRNSIAQDLDACSVYNAVNGGVVIAVGLSDYDPETDTAVASVFERADELMYKRKKELKGQA